MDDLQIEPREVRERLERGHKFLLVDIRNPDEHQICRIEGAQLVPMDAIPANLGLFEQAEDVVLYCHHGIRSMNAAAWLQSQGIRGARSMAGGIERWSLEIDPSIPRY